MPPTPDDIRRELLRLLAPLDVPAGAIPDTVDRDAGYPFWGVRGDVLFFTAHERGRPTFLDETHDLRELLYWICRSVVRGLADEAARRSSRRKDQRRARFAREAELLDVVDPAWGARRRAEHAEILARYPFRDRG